MEFLQIFLLSFVRINSTYSVKFRAKVFALQRMSDLPRDTIKFTALKSLSGVAAETVGRIVPVSTL